MADIFDHLLSGTLRGAQRTGGPREDGVDEREPRLWQIGNCVACGGALFEMNNSPRFPRSLPVKGEYHQDCKRRQPDTKRNRR